MVAFEPEKVSIAGLRGMEGQEWPTGMVDRLFRRIVLMAYGEQINKFTDRKQFLYAFRDAVGGHQNMWDINVIHRDISINNILIGEEDAGAGWQGVVIDLDMAVFWEHMTTMAAVDFRTGTRAFQSLFVMANGKPVEKPPLAAWESENLEFAIAAKSAFLNPMVIKHNAVNHTFGKVFQDLFDALRGFFLEKYKWKTENRDTMPNKMDAMKEHSMQHYAEFLAHIDTAVTALEEEENGSPSSSPVPSPPPEPALTHSPHSSQQMESSSGMKRTRGERDAGGADMDIDGEGALPAPKRLHMRILLWSQPETVPEAVAGAAPTAVPAPRRLSRLQTGSTQSAPASIEPVPATVARRQSTRSRNGSRSTQPVEAPVNTDASTWNTTRVPSTNSQGQRGTTQRAQSGGARQMMRARTQSGKVTTERPADGPSTQSSHRGLCHGHSATRKGEK
ncbi:unnamed protein product [Cyclocybe aegerita]|uniref:Fungal-type protein kinase domain-containing protein n=1 Tax=Cyclocybe aegerita TaxID=1973307 RepID=A0A8S0WRH6_CYCAE|nr:unnamed protein product [Cyclocybe aegerita]